MYHLPACFASDVIVIIEAEGESWEFSAWWSGEAGGASLGAVHPGLHHQGRETVQSGDLLRRNHLTICSQGHVFASEREKALALLSDLSWGIQTECYLSCLGTSPGGENNSQDKWSLRSLYLNCQNMSVAWVKQARKLLLFCPWGRGTHITTDLQ